MTKIDFPKILSSRKILIFSHCVGIQNKVGNTDFFYLFATEGCYHKYYFIANASAVCMQTKMFL